MDISMDIHIHGNPGGNEPLFCFVSIKSRHWDMVLILPQEHWSVITVGYNEWSSGPAVIQYNNIDRCRRGRLKHSCQIVE